MISKIISTNEPKPKKAVKHLKNKIRDEIDFSPDLIFFYSTLKYQGNFQYILEEIKKEIGNKPLIGGTVDGVVYPHELRTDGCFLVLLKDKKTKFEVTKTKKRGKTGIKDIKQKIYKKNTKKLKNIILHYPLVFLKNKRELISLIGKGKYYDLISTNKNILKNGKKLSNYLLDKGIFHTPKDVLREISEEKNIPILGVNLFHTRFKTGSPLVFSNWEVLRGGFSALLIKKKEPNISYGDIYSKKPQEGNIREFLKREFQIVKEINLKKVGNTICSINNKKPMKAIRDIKETIEVEEYELLDIVEEGKLEGEVPYVLFLTNPKTGGVANIGISDVYPFNMFPTYLSLEELSEKAYLGFEPLQDFDRFCSSLDNLKKPKKSFTFSVFDISSLESFDLSKIKYTEKLKNKADENYFSIITGSPCIFFPKKYWLEDYLPEIYENILFSGNGINISIEI